MPISEVGMTSSGRRSAGSGWEALPLRTVPTEIDNAAVGSLNGKNESSACVGEAGRLHAQQGSRSLYDMGV